MDFERPTLIVAKNLREFLRVNMTDSELFYNQFDSEVNYFLVRERWADEAAYQPSENDKLVRDRIIKFLMENLQIPTLDNPYLYVQNVELDRQSNVSVKTQDGLGITTPLLQGERHKPFQFKSTHILIWGCSRNTFIPHLLPHDLRYLGTFSSIMYCTTTKNCLK